VGVPSGQERRPAMKIRRFIYSLGWLAALVLAAGAGWKTT
jgi:hypothetical protein